jgi:hypothetical protein
MKNFRRAPAGAKSVKPISSRDVDEFNSGVREWSSVVTVSR